MTHRQRDDDNNLSVGNRNHLDWNWILGTIGCVVVPPGVSTDVSRDIV